MLRVGIIGASGYTGAELLRLSPRIPSFEVVFATGDTQAGTRAGRCTRSLAAAYPDLSSTSSTSARPTGSTSSSSGCRTRRRWRWRRSSSARVGCVVDLSAAFRLKDASAVPDVVRLRARPARAARRGRVRPARAAPRGAEGAPLVATPGCHVTAATLALARSSQAGLDRDRPASSSTPSPGSAAPDAAQAHVAVLHRRRGLHRLRPARPPPHAGDRAGDRRAGAVHPAPRADEPRHPGHLLRPADRRECRRRRRCSPPLARRYARRAVRRRDGRARRRPRRRSASTWPTSRARFDERTGTVIAICAIDNLTKGASGGAVQAANVALGLDETTGLPTVGLYP